MYNRLDSFLKDCNILSDSQYGFIKGKGKVKGHIMRQCPF